MKKSHKREIFVARVIFACFLLIVVVVIALIVVLISSHIKKNDKTESQKPATILESDTQFDIPEPDTEALSPVTEAVEPDTQAAEPVEQTGGSRWTTDSVRFRVEPNTDCEVITGLSAGTEVEFVSEADGWTQVKYNGYTGYISSEFLSTTAPQ